MIQKNVGGLDRTARLIVGPILAVVGVAAVAGVLDIGLAGTVGLAVTAALLVVGAIFIVTGTAQKCPVNQALGVNTCEK